MTKFFLFALVFLLFNNPLYANDLFYSNDWLNCLYYEKNGAEYKSTAEDQKFFISAQGKTNPKSEYEESLKLVLNNDLTFKEKFPYRYKLIAKQNNIDYKPTIKINKNITNVIIVYPNRYMGNPTSMFGHIFLVLESNRGLLDSNILHFTAETNNDRSVNYIIKGLTGQYKGWFLEEPYYKKIKYYNYFEDRDIVYYDLKLSEDQIEDLQLHYIELKNTYFDYYFVDKNCAFYIGRLLNVVINPNIITNGLYMMPSHIVNNLEDNKLLKNERTRISNTKTFNTMFNNLNIKQKREVVDLLKNKTDDIVDDGDVLITFITCSEYMINNNSELSDTIRHNRIQAYKKMRSMNRPVTRVTIANKEEVERIKSGSIKLSRTFNDNYEFQYNPIYFSEYDQLDKLEEVKVKCFGFKVQTNENRLPLYTLDLFDLVNISQNNAALNSFSWKIKNELAYSDSLLGNQDIYVGMGWNYLNRGLYYYLVGLNISNYDSMSGDKLESIKIMPGINIGLNFNLIKNVKLSALYEYKFEKNHFTIEALYKHDTLLNALTFVESNSLKTIKLSFEYLY